MNMADIIHSKRNGGELSRQEIDFFIDGFVKDSIPDYQASALMMAVWFRGMSSRETVDMTRAMMMSGDVIDLSAIPGIKVDKHSTGGVADTTTMIIAPLVAACGGKVAKMSGRGLGHTGGTLDKLESIPGYSVSQSMERFIEIVTQHGLSVIGQTANLVPADKKLYALRDVTATVDNLSLIASSIMSKKLASGSDAIVLDVKTGSGAFMKKLEDAVALAEAMVDIGNSSGKKTSALVTDMSQPLGNAIGNSIEIREAIEILQGQYRGDLCDVAFALSARMLIAAEKAVTEEDAAVMLNNALESGQALTKLGDMIEAQGGNRKVIDDTSLLPRAEKVIPVTADRAGFITRMNTEAIGSAAMLLGAGRATKDDLIDPAVGIWMKKRLGDPVDTGEIVAEFYVNDTKNSDEAIRLFSGALTIESKETGSPQLIHRYIQ